MDPTVASRSSAPGHPEPAAWETEKLLAWRRRTDGVLAVLAIGSIPFLLLEIEYSDLIWADRVLIETVNVVLLVAFGVDYFVELALARNRRRFVRAEWLRLLILVATAVAVLPTLAGFGALRVLRGARAFRFVATVLRVAMLGGLARNELRGVLRRRAGRVALGAAAFTWLTSAVAFTIAEDVGENGRLTSFFDALWWSTTTITTVGYGDIYPMTAAGRIIGGFTMLVGITTFATVTAKLAEFLVHSPPEGD